jgi:hypothetical protein
MCDLAVIINYTNITPRAGVVTRTTIARSALLINSYHAPGVAEAAVMPSLVCTVKLPNFSTLHPTR